MLKELSHHASLDNLPEFSDYHLVYYNYTNNLAITILPRISKVCYFLFHRATVEST